MKYLGILFRKMLGKGIIYFLRSLKFVNSLGLFGLVVLFWGFFRGEEKRFS